MVDNRETLEKDQELIAKISKEVSKGLPSWGGKASSLASLEPEVIKFPASFFLRYPTAKSNDSGSTILVKIPREENVDSIAQAASPGKQLADRTNNEFMLLREVAWLVNKLKIKELTAIEPLFYFPEWNAIVMEELPSKSLEELAFDLRTRFSVPKYFKLFEDSLYRGGQWLRVFHQGLGGWKMEPFDAQDFIKKINRKINQLAPLVSDQVDLAPLHSKFLRLIESLDGVEVPHVNLHGDYFFKNILVTPDGRVAVIDLYLQKWGTIFEDLATMITEIMEQKIKFSSLGFLVRGESLARSEKAVLQGYFTNEMPCKQVLYAFCCLDILIMWYWYEERYRSISGPATGAARLLRPRIRQYLLRQAQEYLQRASQAANSESRYKKMGKSPQKIALIKMGSFSLVNEYVEDLLSREFPDYDLDVIDIHEDLVSRKSPVNILSVLRFYGLDIVLGKRKLMGELSEREILSRTTYFYNEVKQAIGRRLVSYDYLFSLQTQSLFDASRVGLPHFVYTDHTHLANLKYPEFDPNMLYSTAWIELEKKIYQNANIVFSTSNFVVKSVIEDYDCDAEKAVCVYSGINVDADIEIDKKNYADKHILFVGIGWERKDGPLVVEAFKGALNAHPDAKLTIVGCQPEIDVKGVSVVGRVPKEEVAQYYQAATIFCMPSKLEPSAAALAEAAAHGIPVISTDIGGTPDRVIHGETGYLIEPGDKEALTKYLIALLDDQKKRREFGRKGYEIAKDRFRWENVGNRIKTHIQAALQG